MSKIVKCDECASLIFKCRRSISVSIDLAESDLPYDNVVTMDFCNYDCFRLWVTKCDVKLKGKIGRSQEYVYAMTGRNIDV